MEETSPISTVVVVATCSTALLGLLVACLVFAMRRRLASWASRRWASTPITNAQRSISEVRFAEDDSIIDQATSKISDPSVSSDWTPAIGDWSEAMSKPSSLVSRTYSSLESMKRPYVELEQVDKQACDAAVCSEIARWPADARGEAAGVVQEVLALLSEANDGALVVVSPFSELQRLRTTSTDAGYMTRRVKGCSVFSNEFRQKFLDFTSHTEDDRWSMDHEDSDARGRPKDGALLLLPTGMPAKCATKLVGLPLAPCQWAGYGTRHETALSLAAFLRQGVVIIRSSSGYVHVLLARDRGGLILQPRWLVAEQMPPATSHAEPDMQASIASGSDEPQPEPFPSASAGASIPIGSRFSL